MNTNLEEGDVDKGEEGKGAGLESIFKKRVKRHSMGDGGHNGNNDPSEPHRLPNDVEILKDSSANVYSQPSPSDLVETGSGESGANDLDFSYFLQSPSSACTSQSPKKSSQQQERSRREKMKESGEFLRENENNSSQALSPSLVSGTSASTGTDQRYNKNNNIDPLLQTRVYCPNPVLDSNTVDHNYALDKLLESHDTGVASSQHSSLQPFTQTTELHSRKAGSNEIELDKHQLEPISTDFSINEVEHNDHNNAPQFDMSLTTPEREKLVIKYSTEKFASPDSPASMQSKPATKTSSVPDTASNSTVSTPASVIASQTGGTKSRDNTISHYEHITRSQSPAAKSPLSPTFILPSRKRYITTDRSSSSLSVSPGSHPGDVRRKQFTGLRRQHLSSQSPDFGRNQRRGGKQSSRDANKELRKTSPGTISRFTRNGGTRVRSSSPRQSPVLKGMVQSRSTDSLPSFNELDSLPSLNELNAPIIDQLQRKNNAEIPNDFQRSPSRQHISSGENKCHNAKTNSAGWKSNLSTSAATSRSTVLRRATTSMITFNNSNHSNSSGAGGNPMTTQMHTRIRSRSRSSPIYHSKRYMQTTSAYQSRSGSRSRSRPFGRPLSDTSMNMSSTSNASSTSSISNTITATASTTLNSSSSGVAASKKIGIVGASHVPLSTLSVQLFDIIGSIGHGAFGKVLLVKDIPRKRKYAMKVLSKAFVAHNNSFLNVKQEIETLKICRGHPYIIQLHYVFQDARNVYLILDYARNGSMAGIVEREKSLSASVTLFYIAQLVLALGHLHARGIVYFDLKLENILMHSNGHLALADMGLSYQQDKLLSEAPLICGTPAYMAPEQVRCGGNGKLSDEIQKTVDWWALGLVAYEMNIGRHPFQDGDTLKANFVKILTCEVDFRGMNPALESLISAFLCSDYRRRLGYGPNGTQNVKLHPTFHASSQGQHQYHPRGEVEEDITSDHQSPHADSMDASSHESRTRRRHTTNKAFKDKQCGIMVDWRAFEARECKPKYSPGKRGKFLDKGDVDINYKVDPFSRSNTEKHQQASDTQISADLRRKFELQIPPFRASDEAKTILDSEKSSKMLCLQRSNSERLRLTTVALGTVPASTSNVSKRQSDLNDNNNVDSPPAADSSGPRRHKRNTSLAAVSFEGEVLSTFVADINKSSGSNVNNRKT